MTRDCEFGPDSLGAATVVDSTASTVPLNRTDRTKSCRVTVAVVWRRARLSGIGISGIAPAHQRGARGHADQHDRGGYPQARVALGRHRCSGYQTAWLRCWLAPFGLDTGRVETTQVRNNCDRPRPSVSNKLIPEACTSRRASPSGDRSGHSWAVPGDVTDAPDPRGVGVQAGVATGGGEVVGEVRAEPLLDLVEPHPLAAGVRLDLVAAEPADVEVLGLRDARSTGR